MEAIIFIGRIVFSMIFVGAGIGHLVDVDNTAATAERAGLSPAKPLAQISGVAMLAGGVGIIFGIWMDLALLGMAALLLIMGFTMHPFWKAEGAEQQVEMSLFMKNLSMAGAAFALFGFIAGLGYNAQTLTDPLFSL